MSEELVQRKSFRMKKLVPGSLIITIHPFSHPELSKTIHLTDRNPFQVLPLDWAFGIFMDDGLYSMYKKGCFTFDDNKALVKAAYENGAYFGEELDFEPAKEDNMEVIYQMVKSGNRAQLQSAVEKYGRDRVLSIVIQKRNELSVAVVNMCESFFKTQLIMDGEDTIENK